MKTNKNIGIWIRVSTDGQVKDESPEHHEKRARNYAELKGWNIVTIYRLDGLSGKSIFEYPETKRMLKDIKDGTISGLIFSKLARLARNTKELLEIADLFQTQKADLISLAESIDTSTPSGLLFFTIIAAMAQWERQEIAERVAASVPIRASMGKPLGGQASFGYKWVGKELMIDEAEAPIRKLIYETYLKTKRRKTTADELNRMGYRTRNGSLFSDTTVERLIKDPTAKGIRRANYTRSLGEGKNWVIKPESEWIEVPCPAIVDETLWNDCNAIMEQQQAKRSKPGPRAVYLLSGYVYCSCFSKMYVRTTWPVYKCAKCKRKVEVKDLDEIYHEQLRTFLLTESDAMSYSSQSDSLIAEKKALLNTVQSEYEKLQIKAQKQMTLRMEGELSKEDFAAFYQPTEQQLRQLEVQIPEIEAELDFLKIQYLSTDTIQQEAKDLYNNWPNLPFDQKRSVIETITERLTVGQDSIDIQLSYQPAPASFLNRGNSPHISRDS